MIDNKINPYTPDAGARPPALVGRERELTYFSELIERLGAGIAERGMITTGMRGVGKTVLLNEFERIAADHGWYTELYEAVRASSFVHPIIRGSRRILMQMSAKKRLQERVRRALGVLKAFSLAVGGPTLKLDVEMAVGIADSGDLAEDLRDLLLELGEVAAGAGSGVVLFFDEMQLIKPNEYEALLSALHRVKQKNLPLTLVGAGLPLLPALSGEAKSYAERMFFYPKIGALNDTDAANALTIPAQERGVAFEPDAVQAILELSEGYPYFLQEYGKNVWRIANSSPITQKDVEAATPIVRDFLDQNFYEVRMGRLTETQKRYLAAFAALGNGPQRTGQIAEKLNISPKKQNALSLPRDELMKVNLIYSPKRGYVDFTVPRCAEYIRRVYPL